MEQTFLYTVNPRRIIKGISGVKEIRTAKSLQLTKEDVLICLKNATVYRRFANVGINERVNIGNIDRVHREEYIPEDKWEAFLASEKAQGNGLAVEPVHDVAPEVKEESVVEEAAPEVVEEVEVESDDEEVENDGVFDSEEVTE